MSVKRLDFWKLLLLGAAVVGFQILFYLQILPNSPERITRYQVLQRACLPSNLENLFVNAARELSWIGNLDQRIPLLVTAMIIVVVSGLLGDMLLRVSLGTNRVTGLQRLVLSLGLGMGTVSLSTQALGLVGWLDRWLFGVLGFSIVALWIVIARPWKRENLTTDPDAAQPSWSFRLLVFLGMVPFAILSLLAASLPSTDYDAIAYHLLGPKEYWLEGQIRFLPHNVYTTFPFLTEMFHLLAMTLTGDPYKGALVGQLTLWFFGPATAAVVYLLGSRLFSPAAGWLGALVYLTTPWIYRLSVIPYVEGALLFYATLAVYAGLRSRDGNWRWALIAGGFSGCAIGCKYPGLVMVAVPVGLLVLLGGLRRRMMPVTFAFLLGTALFAGPWLVRNIVWTGNPVYPLFHSVLGGKNWSPEKAEKFYRVHRPPGYRIGYAWAEEDAPRNNFLEPFLLDIVLRSDWQSALVFAFAPLAFLGKRKRSAADLWILMLFQFLVFWTLTHRVDRFWLPLLPLAAVLAGAGMIVTVHRGWRLLRVGTIGLAIFYNLAYCTSTTSLWVPEHMNTTDLDSLRTANTRKYWPAVALANEAQLIPPDTTVLYVGFAGVFDSIPRSLYNTVFDDNLFEQMVRQPGTIEKLRSTEAIHEELSKADFSFVLVDWTWIDRYRSPGNYGFTNFIQPELFDALIALGILEKIPLYPPAITNQPLEIYRVRQNNEF